MTESAEHADVILPGASFLEKSGAIHQWRTTCTACQFSGRTS